MSRTRNSGDSSALSSFSSTIKLFALVPYKILKFAVLPLVLVYKIVRLVVSLRTLVVLTILGLGLFNGGPSVELLGSVGSTGSLGPGGVAPAIASVATEMVGSLLPYS